MPLTKSPDFPDPNLAANPALRYPLHKLMSEDCGLLWGFMGLCNAE